MSTANKLTYLNDTKTKIRNGINAIGGSLDSDDTFRSYADELESLYNEMPKVSDTGTNITLDNTRVGKMTTIYGGDTQQDSTTGKNKCNNVFIQGNINNNTSTNRIVTSNDLYLESGNYTISTNLDLTSYKFAVVATSVARPTANTNIIFDSGWNATSYTLNLTTSAYVYILIAYTNQWSTEPIYPTIMDNKWFQIENGSSATSYEPYTNGASPNPDYPQDIHVVSGDNTIKASNKKCPSGYTQVDYIQNSGFAYIDLGIKGNQNTNFNIKFETPNDIYTSRAIFGYYGDTTNSYYLYVSASKKFQFGYKTYADFGNVINANTIYEISNNANVLNINGTTYTHSNTSAFDTTPNNLYLFNLNGGTYSRMFIKLYYFKLYDNGTLVRDMIPCYRNSDNEVGLYDLVSKTFFTNAGTGSFTYGAVDENSQNYLISLGDIELNKIGDYQDSIFYNTTDTNLDLNSWYIKKEIGSGVLDGDEAFTSAGTSGTDFRYNKQLSTLGYANATSNNALCMANYFENVSIKTDKKWGAFYVNGNWLVFYDKDQEMTNATTFNTWLSTHNTIVKYVLATPTYTKITDTTLLGQLEAIKSSYEGQTNISQDNDDLPFILDMSALKEWE